MRHYVIVTVNGNPCKLGPFSTAKEAATTGAGVAVIMAQQNLKVPSLELVEVEPH